MRTGSRLIAPVAIALALIGSSAGPARAHHAAADPGGSPWLGTLAPELLHLAPADSYRLDATLARALGTDTISTESLARRVAARPALPGEPTPPVGTTLLWPAMDTVRAIGGLGIYVKPYTLRAVGQHIEVWVASGTDGVSKGTEFPAGDCRNPIPGSTDVTDAQVRDLVAQFDDNMYPKETKSFSTPPERNGTSTVPGLSAAGLNFSGTGGHTVTLVDNVRDENFYDFEHNRSYIAGFYAPIFNQLTDRNVMTIDAFDWLHRTGAHPKDEPDKDFCKSRPARPRSYEATFAHEWQHLLHQYKDPDETSWVNEGLSMYAESLVGYTDTTRTHAQRFAQGHLMCFQGYGDVKGPSTPNPSPCGGPQNSLTSWGDEGEGSEILADYGNAWSFMLYLADRFGRGVLEGLHRDGKAQGLASLQNQLDDGAKGAKVADVLHDYQLMNLLDRYLDDGAKVSGGDRKNWSARELHSRLNLDEKASYAAPGAAPNGADYLRLGKGSALKSLRFTGEKSTLAPPTDETNPLAALDQGSEPGSVDGWYVSLVGIDEAGKRVLVRSHPGFEWAPSRSTLAQFRGYPMVVAVVAHDNADDLNLANEVYAHYTLEANGEERPGG